MCLLRDWPRRDTLETCKKSGRILLSTAFPKRPDAFHRIPVSFLENLFTAEFWERATVDGMDLLRSLIVGSWSFDFQLEREKYIQCDAGENLRILTKQALEKRLLINHQTFDQIEHASAWKEVSSQGTQELGTGKGLKRKRRLSDIRRPGSKRRKVMRLLRRGNSTIHATTP